MRQCYSRDVTACLGSFLRWKSPVEALVNSSPVTAEQTLCLLLSTHQIFECIICSLHVLFGLRLEAR